MAADSWVTRLQSLHLDASHLEPMLALLPCALFVCSFDPGAAAPRYTFASARVRSLLGIEPDALLLDADARLRNIRSEYVERLSRVRLLAREGAWKETFCVVVTGRERWIEESARLHERPDGSAIAHGYWAEVAPPGQVGPDREHRRDRFREVFECAPQAIGISNGAGRILALNPAYTQTFGYTLEDGPTLERMLELVHPDPEYRAQVYREWQAAVEEYQRMKRPGGPLVVRMTCKDGSERIAEIRTSAAANDESIVIFTDISDLVKAQEERTHAEKERARALSQLELQSSHLPMALVITGADADLTIRQWNPGAERIFGYGPEEAIGRSPFGLLIPAEQRRALQNLAQRHAETEGTVRIVSQNVTKDGRRISCEWFNTPIRDDAGQLLGMMSMGQDVTERILTEERMKLWTSVLDHCSEGIMICDAQKRILLVNAAFEKLTGYREGEVLGQTPSILQSGRQGPSFYAEMWLELVRSGHWAGELWNRRKSGEIYPEWLSINAVRDESALVTHYVGIFSDITARKESEERIRHLAQFDSLTGLPNRALLADRLAQLIHAAARSQAKLALLFIDLDRFKEVNDSMGHEAGDLLLISIAKRLQQCVRESDTVARMGGDEFIVATPQLAQAEDAAVVARKVLSAIKEPLSISGTAIAISGSVGICVFPDDGTTASQLIRNADSAMYQAKRSGRDAYRFYTSSMNDRALERLSMEAALRSAVAEQEFILHYQPQIDIGSGSIIGAEALVRWNRPGFGLVPPGEFIPIAEERGLIVSIGKWALDESARQAAIWKKEGVPLRIAVNISSIEFHQRGFVEQIAAALSSHRLPPQYLELEITEGVMIREADAAIALLRRLHRMGIELSIDDFGTGFSSLNYLRRLPIHRLKIDRSFVDEITHHPETVRVVHGIVALAKGLGLRVVAEGVETQAQLALLREAGCDEAQGFLFSRALPADAFEKFVRHWRSRS